MKQKKPSRNSLARQLAKAKADLAAAIMQGRHWRDALGCEEQRHKIQADSMLAEIKSLRERLNKFTDAILDSPRAQVGITQHSIPDISSMHLDIVARVRIPRIYLRMHRVDLLREELAIRLGEEIKAKAIQNIKLKTL